MQYTSVFLAINDGLKLGTTAEYDTDTMAPAILIG